MLACKRYSNPITGLDRPQGFQEVEDTRFQDSLHMKVVRSALRTGRLNPTLPENIPGTHFCYRLSQPQGHSAAGRIMSMKNSDIIGNRTRDLPACSAVPQPTAPPRAVMLACSRQKKRNLHFFFNQFACYCPTSLWQCS